MAAHQVRGELSVTRGDGIDDAGVFLEGTLVRLVAHAKLAAAHARHLREVVIQNADEPSVAATPDDTIVKSIPSALWQWGC